jgi:5'(3')-deoxyribonucleotidase
VSTAILLDVDGVLADTCTAMMRWAHALGADPAITADNLGTYEVESLLADDNARARFWQRVTARGFCAALQPYPGALDLVQELRQAGDVVAVTAPMRAPHWAHERAVWLHDHFGFERDHVVSTAGKHWVAGDFFCDDSAVHLATWSQRWGSVFPALNMRNRAFLIDRPYNTAGPCVFPRGSLADFVTYVRGFLEASAGVAAQ